MNLFRIIPVSFLIFGLALAGAGCGQPDHEKALETAKTLRQNLGGLSDTDAIRYLNGSEALFERLAAIKIEAQQNRVHVLKRLAERQIQSGLLSDALKTVEKLIQLQPADHRWYRMKGRILAEWGQVEQSHYQKARSAFEQALSLKPGDLRARYQYGLLLGFKLGRYEEGKKQLQRVAWHNNITAVNREQIKNARFALAKLGYENEEYSVSREALLQIVEMDGISLESRMTAYRNLGDTYRAMGLRDEAIKAYREALDINPRSSEIKNRLNSMDAGAPD